MGYYRSIRTTSERRQANGYEVDCREDEMLPPIRRKRSARYIPNSWDDINRGDWDAKNWKHYRKTQWKPKELPKEKKHSKFRGHISIWPIYQYGETVWAYKRCAVSQKWNLDGYHYSWEVVEGKVRRVKKEGCWEAVYEWQWRGKQPYCTFYEGETTKTWRIPIIEQEPGFLNGEPYFVMGEHGGFRFKTITKKK